MGGRREGQLTVGEGVTLLPTRLRQHLHVLFTRHPVVGALTERRLERALRLGDEHLDDEEHLVLTAAEGQVFCGAVQTAVRLLCKY